METRNTVKRPALSRNMEPNKIAPLLLKNVVSSPSYEQNEWVKRRRKGKPEKRKAGGQETALNLKQEIQLQILVTAPPVDKCAWT